MSDDLRQCRICQGPASETFEARELMYGTREVFSYFECASCGCVQISEIPKDLGRFYPDDYYSYQPRAISAKQTAIAYVKRGLVFAGGKFPSLREIVSRFGASMELLLLYRGLAPAKDAAILDVGCGSGDLLRHLADVGYRNATGVDPFVPGDQVYRGRVLVRQADIFDIHDQYDVISFHHSLEHLPDQHAVLRKAARLLKPGALIVRIPIVGGNAWKNTVKSGSASIRPGIFTCIRRKAFRCSRHGLGC